MSGTLALLLVLAGVEVTPLGRPLVIPHGVKADGLAVGGLSGLASASDGSYWAVTDGYLKTRARVVRLAFAVGPQGIAPLPGDTPRTVVKATVRLQGFDSESFDGEGVAVMGQSLLLSSEIEPSIRQFSLDGKLVRKLPVPPQFVAGASSGIRKNEGFEALSLSGDSLWTANERPLQQDAPDDKGKKSPVRLLRYARSGESFVPAEQLVYEVEPIERPPRLRFHTRGLVDLLPLEGGHLLALEREYVKGRGNKLALYRVDLRGATDVSGLRSLSGASYEPVSKTLLYDFSSAGFVPDNLEGMTWGPKLPDGSRVLLLVSDDNFDRRQETQILALRVAPAPDR